MLACFSVKPNTSSILIELVPQKNYPQWLKQQSSATQTWLASIQARGEAGQVHLMPHASGKISKVIAIVNGTNDLWSIGHLPMMLPEGHYQLENAVLEESLAVGWGLGAYQFTRYKKPQRKPAVLVLSKKTNRAHVEALVESIYFIRDLINTPTEDMGPTEFSKEARRVAKRYQAKITEIIGEALLKKNYASIYTVGRASDDAPRLIELTWGNPKHPRICLVGKGVCFDSGGLDIKTAAGMLLMKKDMAGAAHVLGLAQMIMESKLPIHLRVLMPVVENVISGNAYRPGDVIQTRKGITVEVTNTDAEGRLILADALAAAVEGKPELIIDISTLTGAARVALGTDISGLFANQDAVANALLQSAQTQTDPMWRLPLFAGYRDGLNSVIADINNSPMDGYAGAITAALFLKEFVPDDIPWVHFDLMAWNLKSRPGRPVGGEAMAVRGIFDYLSRYLVSKNVNE